MTTNELFDKITSEPKWYASKIDRHHASLIKKKHREGRYTNYEWLFGLFGYIKQPDEWVKNSLKLSTSGNTIKWPIQNQEMVNLKFYENNQK